MTSVVPTPIGSADPGRRATAVCVVVVSFALVVGAAGGAAPTGNAQGAQTTANATAASDDADRWTTPPTLSQAGGAASDDGAVDDEQRAAAETGVNRAVDYLRRQGVSVNASQRAAAINGSVAAVRQTQNATAAQVRNASYGATIGALRQSGAVSPDQVGNATAGAVAGALSQSATASATQLQHAAFGGAHGAVAQHQNARVEQVQAVAAGAAAGAAHEAGKRAENGSAVHPGAIREAAQGAAFGAMVRQQNVTIEQRQHAAAGAAEGALNQTHDASVEQRQRASVKEIQVAAMGAAEGALSVEQRQTVRVEQVQAAARGACKGALTQVQSVSVTQIQAAALGAARGSVSQSQNATVEQVQAAANGGASGVLVQRQSVSVSQVQYAAAGASRGALRSAVQHQVANVRQIQAAAAGAGQGSIVRVQRVTVVQVQIVADSAAGGALSQYQAASVTQIQSAAEGASTGALSLVQRQEITIEQTQVITRSAASDAASAAAAAEIDVDVAVYQYAKGAAQSPDDDDEDDGDADEDELRSLFAAAQDDAVFLANPNDVAVTVTITSEAGDVRTRTLAAGESTTLDLDAGVYTITAETADGRDVQIAGRDELTVSVGGALQSLAAEVDGRQLVVTNPNDERVLVTADPADGTSTTFAVPQNWDVSRVLDPGEYTVSAETLAGDSVPVNGESSVTLTIEGEEPPEDGETPPPEDGETPPPEDGDGPPETVDLDVALDRENLTVENPSTITVTVTATNETGANRTFDVGGGATVTESFAPGNYTLTGEADGDAEVLFEGDSTYAFQVEDGSAPAPAEGLRATYANGTLTLRNPSDTAVEATVEYENDSVTRTVDAGAVENLTALPPGDYTVTATAPSGESVPVDGADTFEFSVPALGPDSAVAVEAGERIERTADDHGVADDWYAVQVAAGNALKVVHHAPTSNVRLRVLDEDGRVIATGRPSEEFAATGTVVNETGTYYVNVRGQSPVSAPTYDAWILTAAPAEFEPNDDAESATPVESGERVSATVLGRESDWYAISAQRGERLNATITVEQRQLHYFGNLEVAVLAPNGTAIGEHPSPYCQPADQPSNRTTSSVYCPHHENATQTAVAPENGTYYVRVDGFEYGDSPPEYSVQGFVDYALNVTTQAQAGEGNETGQRNDTEAAVAFADQSTEGDQLTVQNVTVPDGGFVAVERGAPGRPDGVLGASGYLAPGTHENVTVTLDPPLSANATLNATAFRDADGDERFEWVNSDGAVDGPYRNATGAPVSDQASVTVRREPEADLSYVNCTTARASGTYDRVAVTLAYYESTGSAASEYVLTGADLPWDRPVAGEAIVTVGESNATRVREDGTRVVTLADPGAFGDDAGSFVANVSAAESPAGDAALAAAQPEADACREAVRPEPPTLSVDSVTAPSNESAEVTFSYENPNDAPLVPAESAFTNGSAAEEPPTRFEPGTNEVTVEWTPESPSERLVWTLNLSNFGLANVSAAGPTAAAVPGLLEPPTETPTPEPTETPTAEPTDTPTPETTEPAETTDTPEQTETPTPAPTETSAPEPTDTQTPEPTETPTPEPTDTQTPEPTETPTPEPTDTPTPESTEPAPEGANAPAPDQTPTETEAG